MIYYENTVTDPCFNLAVEETLLRDAELDSPVFLLWRNEPTVVVGRNQNTVEEVDASYVERHGIHVVRRLTGGGAVYHDLGNLNYSFIMPDTGPGFDFRRWSEPVIAALASLGVKAGLSGRNDLEIDGRKFSGAAQARVAGRLLHHGTLLFRSDLNVLARVLTVSADKIASKAVRSVRARVVNIADCLPASSQADISALARALRDEMAREFGLAVHEFSADQLERIERLRATRYSTWDWNYGRSPAFNVCRGTRYSWGKVEFRLVVRAGIVAHCTVFGDFFSGADVRQVAARIVGHRFERAELAAALDDALIRLVFPQWSAEQAIAMLFDSHTDST